MQIRCNLHQYSDKVLNVELVNDHLCSNECRTSSLLPLSLLLQQNSDLDLCSNECRTSSLLPLSLLLQQNSDLDFFGARNPLRNKLPLNFDFLHRNPFANHCRTTPL